MDKSNNVWHVRNVPQSTRKKIRVYALERGITVAEALEELVALQPIRHTDKKDKIIIINGEKFELPKDEPNQLPNYLKENLDKNGDEFREGITGFPLPPNLRIDHDHRTI